jgi:hypothetical protein
MCYLEFTSRLYAHLGFIDSRYELWSESFGSNKGSQYKWLPGGRVGFGMQSKLTSHWVIRTDCTFNFFDSWMPYNTQVIGIKFSPRTYSGTIGLDYYFSV